MPTQNVSSNESLLTQKPVVFTILIASLMLLIFVTDLQFTTGVYIGILYIGVIMFSLGLPSLIYTLTFAWMSTFLAIFGFLYSIYAISPTNQLQLKNVLNILMIVSMIWITTVIAMYIKRISMALHKSETIYKAILNTSIDPIFIVNTQGIIESVSNTVESSLGWEPRDLQGKKFVTLLGNEFRDQYEELFLQGPNKEHPFIDGNLHESIALHRLRKEFPCELSINYLEIPEVHESFFTVGLRDISTRKAYEKKLGWMMDHDELTKIKNRRYFNEHIHKEWLRMLRSRESLALLSIDLDHFKLYNDALGPEAGDASLQKIANVLHDSARRAGDVAARYGGEEFTVLLPATDLAGAQDVANTILKKVSELNIPHPNNPNTKRLTVSIGISAMVPLMGCSYERLLRFAEQALYEAKHSGRNKTSTYQD